MKKNIFYKQLNLGAKMLSGLCLCVAINSCDENANDSQNSSVANVANVADLASISPSTNIDSLKQVLAKENFVEDGVTDDVLNMYVEMSKIISKEQVEKELKKNCAQAKASSKEDFKKLSQQSLNRASAVHLYSQGKDIYSLQKDRNTLFETVRPHYSDVCNEDPQILQSQAIEICLNRVKNDNENIKKLSLNNISTLLNSTSTLLNNVNSTCLNTEKDINAIKSSIIDYQTKIKDILKKSNNTENKITSINKLLDDFHKDITTQVEATNTKLAQQTSNLQKQEKNVKAIKDIVYKTQSTQSEFNDILLQTMNDQLNKLQLSIQNTDNNKQIESKNRNDDDTTLDDLDALLNEQPGIIS